MPLSFPETVTRLYETMNDLVPFRLYPEGVKPVPADKITGTAFFPGGSGLYLEGRDPATIEFPERGAMILGHNFTRFMTRPGSFIFRVASCSRPCSQ